MSSSKFYYKDVYDASIVIFDEAAFFNEYGQKVYNSLKLIEPPFFYGDRVKIIMASTPNGKDKLFYKTYIERNDYHFVDFKWFEDPRFNKNLKWYNERENRLMDDWFIEDNFDTRFEFKFIEEKRNNLLKNGWKPTSPWYEGMCKIFYNDSKSIARELDASFT